MASYKEIHGTNIQVVSSNPSNPIDGQVWYNSTDKVLRAFKDIPSSWATGGNLNTARGQMSGAGTQTAALGFGGYASTGPVALTESYNGSSWTEVGDINSARRLAAGGGTQTAALLAGGHEPPPTAYTETWNGSSWTEVGDLNEGRRQLAGDGSTTSFLVYGGEPPQTEKTESWNGSSWTEVADLNTRRSNAGAAGASNTSSLCFGGVKFNPGGDPPSGGAHNESWNGSSWTELADLNTPRYGVTGAGIATAALAMGGTQDPPVLAITESWNGSAWTETADLSTARNIGDGGAGTNTVGLCFGGFEPSRSNKTEEFSGGGPSIVTFTTD